MENLSHQDVSNLDMFVYEEDKQRWLWEEITWVTLKRGKIWQGCSSPAFHLEFNHISMLANEDPLLDEIVL